MANQPISAAAVTKATPRAKVPNNGIESSFNDGVLSARIKERDMQFVVSKDGKTQSVHGADRFTLKDLDAGNAEHDGLGYVASRTMTIKYFTPEFIEKRIEKQATERWKKFITFAFRDLTTKELEAYYNGEGEMRWLFMTLDRKHVSFSKRPYNESIDKNLWVPPIAFDDLPEATKIVFKERLGKKQKSIKPQVDFVTMRRELRELLQAIPEDNPGRQYIARQLLELDAAEQKAKDAEKKAAEKAEKDFQAAVASGDDKKISKARERLLKQVAKFEKAAKEDEAE